MGVQKLDYTKISNSCLNIKSVAEKMQTTEDSLNGTLSMIDSGWIGVASEAYRKKIDYFIKNFDEAKRTLAMSVLFLSGCADGYKSIDNETYSSLIALIGGQDYIDKIDVSKISSSSLPLAHAVEDVLSSMEDVLLASSEYANPAGLSGYQLDFINEIKQGAIDTYNEYGILPSLTMAQAILETGWGQSRIGNNIFGIKGSWNGKSKTVSTQEYVNGSYVTINAEFRDYDNVSQSIIDHAQLLNNDRYSEVPKAKNYAEAARAVHNAGYATDPGYSDKLIDIIESYGLDQWDGFKGTLPKSKSTTGITSAAGVAVTTASNIVQNVSRPSQPSISRAAQTAVQTASAPIQSHSNHSSSVSYKSDGTVSHTIPNEIRQGGYTVTGYDAWIDSGNTMNWAAGTNQSIVADIWKDQGAVFKNGIATIKVNGEEHYLIACSQRFGKVGDQLTITLDNGEKIKAIIADAKSNYDSTSAEYGHRLGDGSTNILEFEVQRSMYLEHGNPNTKSWGLEWDSSSDVSTIDNHGSIISNA